MSDADIRRSMILFVNGASFGFSIEELEAIEKAAGDTRQNKEREENLVLWERDAEDAARTMGEGWTNIHLVLDPVFYGQDIDAEEFKTRWEIPVLVPLFIPVGGHNLHIFVGPGPREHRSKAQAVCGTFKGTDLDVVRLTYQVAYRPVRGLRASSLGLCEKCAQPAPYELRWLPPQTERLRQTSSVG